jgi:hypothetical protein
MNAHRIIITPTLDMEGRQKRSSKGSLFDASYEGQVIVVGSTEPSLDSARALKARGLTGRLEMWDAVLPYCRFRANLDKAAGLTVREGDEPPRLVKFESFAPHNVQDGGLASGGATVSQTAETGPGESPAALMGRLAEPRRCPANVPRREQSR